METSYYKSIKDKDNEMESGANGLYNRILTDFLFFYIKNNFSEEFFSKEEIKTRVLKEEGWNGIKVVKGWI